MAGVPAEPRKEDFGRYEDYVSALAEHRVEARLRSDAAQARQREHATLRAWAGDALDVEFKRASGEMRQRAADFDQVAFNKDLPIPPTVGRLIVAAERSAELLYHLGKNPELARRLAALPPTIAAKELGKIEAQLPASQATSAAPTSEQQRRATSAPAPVRTVKAGANPPRRSVESMSFDEYVAGRRSGAIK